jgi:hypothetical protein
VYRHKYVWDKSVSDPFARLLLFDGRQLIEQRQTTFSSAPIHIKWRKRNGSSASAGRDTTFPESFLFNVPLNALARYHIVVEVSRMVLICNVTELYRLAFEVYH